MKRIGIWMMAAALATSASAYAEGGKRPPRNGGGDTGQRSGTGDTDRPNQSGEGDKSGQSDRHPPPPRMPDLSSLNLTAEQTTQVKGILQEMLTECRPIMEDKSLTREQKHTKVQAIREATDEKLTAILTEDQVHQLHEQMRPPGRPPRDGGDTGKTGKGGGDGDSGNRRPPRGEGDNDGPPPPPKDNN